MDTKNLSYTSVEEIYCALNKIISLKASNLSELSSGNTPEVLLSDRDWDSAQKVLDKLPTLEAFHKIANGISTPSKGKKEKEAEPTEEEPETAAGNPFEERSRLIKERLNGASSVGTKKN